MISWFQTGLPLEYKATIMNNGTRWQGDAYIPLTYFPYGVDKFNAFAMHGVGKDRQYEQVFDQKIPLLSKPDL